MRKTCMLVMLGVVPLFLSAAEVYRYVDPERGVEYSDMPRPGAERIFIPDPPVAPPLNVRESPLPDDRIANLPTGTALAYSEIAIADPLNEDTVRDNAGNLIVAVSLNPPLQAEFGHQLQLLLDGEVVASGTSSHMALNEVDRGTHTLQAVVLGVDGAVLTQSAVTTFHLHRMSKPQIEKRKRAAKAAEDAQR
jgi:hypothetical protein